MNIRELPRKVEGLPILKVTYLGWLSHYAVTPGYFCVVITYGTQSPEEGDRFHVHVMRALGLAKPWNRIESHRNLRNGEASAKFSEVEKLAEWPKGDGT